MARKRLRPAGLAFVGLALTLGAFAYVRAQQTLQGQNDVTVKNNCIIPDAFLNPIASQVYIGNAVTLTWSTTDALELESSFDETGLNGSTNRTLNSLGSHTFTVTAKRVCGDETLTKSASRTTTVVNPPPPPPPPPNYHRCFVAGTLITMADGTTKPVEQVQAGDMVKSYDVNTGQWITSKVTDRYKSEWDSFYQINGSNGVTGPHLFWANGKWTRVDELKVGDKLFNEKGEAVEITSLVKRPGPVDIFPLFVEDPPASYVAEGVVVHNHNDGGPVDGEGLVAGTTVLMADGSRKPIELVKEGDGLMSYFPKKRGMGTAKVRKVFPGSTAAEYVVLNGKLALGPGHRLRTTKGKPAEDKK